MPSEGLWFHRRVVPSEGLWFHRRVGGADVEPPEENAPRVVGGRYEIRGLLGSGGMGSVFRAFDRELEEIVALKVIRSDLLQHPELRERFRKEVKLARRITHRNVARVFDIGEAGGERYLTMELVEGRSLAAMLDQGPAPIAEVIRIGRELAEGLAAAHAVGVIHRDLKPDNVLLADDGRVVITDFGIARSLDLPSSSLTLSGQLLGTPDYLSPELVAGEGPADARCDIFALGVILFEAITGRMPWEGGGLGAIAARLAEVAPASHTLRPDTPVALSALVQRCLARDPRDRPDSAARLARELTALDELRADPSQRATIPQVETTPWSPERIPPGLAPHASGTRSVAVLPFDEAEEGERGTYFSDGVTDVLIESLGRARSLVVRPRGMVMPLRGSRLDAPALGKALGVDAVVLGAIARSEETLGLSVRVIDATFGFQLWAFRRTCSPDQIFSVIDEIANGIAGALSSARAQGSSLPQPSTEGFADVMLRARHAYHSFWQEETAKAIVLFEQALALCPTAPRALAGYAMACLREGFFTGAGLQRVRAAIERASAAEPDLPELHLARASVLVQESEPVAAVAELRRALDQAPDLAEASWLLGRLLLEADAVEIAAKRLAWALVIEPALSVARRDCARASAMLGRWEEAERISSAEPGGEAVGPWLDRGRFAMWKRDAEIARMHLAVFPSLADLDPTTQKQLGIARALLVTVAQGTSPFGDPALQDFGARAGGTRRRGAFVAQIEAEIHAFLGQRADALRAIEAAVQAGLTDLAWLERCPLFEELREEPSFAQARVAVGRIAAPVRDAILGS